MNCGHWALWHQEVGLKRFLCGKATCSRPECQKRFYANRLRLVSDLVTEYGLDKFFTLTLDPKFIEGDPWDYIRQPWSKFRHRVKRKSVNTWKFVAVLESHKTRDVPHIHGFTNFYMQQSEWSKLWHESCGGSVVWVEAVRTGAAEYVNKTLQVARYVGKDQLVEARRNSERHRTLWRSKNLKAKFELTSQDGWCIIKDRVFDEQGEVTPLWQDRRIQYHGNQEKSEGQDLEATLRAVPSSGTQESLPDLEAREG